MSLSRLSTKNFHCFIGQLKSVTIDLEDANEQKN